MTHELAHLVGSEHDQSPPTAAIKGHPGSLKCLWKSGYIMSYENNGPEHHQFSSCSIEQMQYVIKLRGKLCWSVTREGKTREGQFAGMVVSLKRFCKRLFPDKPDVTADMDSQYLQKCKIKCKYSVVSQEYHGNTIRTYTTWYSKTDDALDYMSCAPGKVCIKGLCVPKPPEKPKKPKPKRKPTPSEKKLLTTTEPTSWLHVSRRQNPCSAIVDTFSGRARKLRKAL